MTPSHNRPVRKPSHATTGSEIAQTVNATLDLDILMRLVILEITKSQHYQAGGIWLLDDHNGNFWFKAGLGLGGPVRHRLGSAPLPAAAGLGEEPQCFSGSGLESQLPPALAHEGILFLVSVPLRAKNKTIGIMHLYAKTSRRFTATERNLFRTWASQAALAIENARVLEDARRKAQELQALHEIAQVVGEMPNLADGLSQIANRVSTVLDVEKCWFMFYDSGTRTLAAHPSAIGAVEEQIAALRFPASAAGVSLEVFRTGRPFYTNDAGDEPLAQAEFRNIFKLENMMAVPIRSRHEILGVFLAANKRDRGLFTGNDVRFFKTLAAEAGMVIENSQRYAALLKSYSRFIHSAVHWAECRADKGHAGRVAHFASLLAGRLHLPDPEIERITLAAWLHDIGKTEIRRKMKTSHAELGARMVEEFRMPWQVAELVRHHHEDYAGVHSGAGKRVVGAVRLGARILAVADPLDHAWRGTLSRRKQQALLRSFMAQSGTRWDPLVIQALEQIWPQLASF